MKFKNLMMNWLATLFLVLMLGCGASDEVIMGDGSVTPTWTLNVFENELLFNNLCEFPRTGVDPFTNENYPDRPGTTLHENHWLRSWSNNTYLWYDEIEDVNPAGFSDTLAYFAILKTNELSPSGQPKDKFHFTRDSAEYQQLVQAGISAGYGAEFRIIRSSVPRKILVAFTEPNSPAAKAGMQRGAELVEIDGVDVVNAGDQASVDILNAAVFPEDIGESHEFVFRLVGETETQTATLVTAEITEIPVQYTQTLDTNSGRVGYMLFNAHILTAESHLIDAVTELRDENITDLILDLRYNPGGRATIASQLSYMIAGEQATAGKDFFNTVFNDKHPNVDPVFGNELSPIPFYSTTLGLSVEAGQNLPTLDLQRVYILSTAGTCSASEAIMNGLRGVDIEVILIGATTCGKPYGFYATDNCGTTYFTVQFKGENDKGFGDYSDGFSPANIEGTEGVILAGCSVADDFDSALGDPNEALYKAALDYRETGVCPTPAAKGVEQMSDKSFPGLKVRDVRASRGLLDNLIIDRQ